MTGFAGDSWVEAIGRALVRSTWQGAAIALILWLALRLLRRASPQPRYLAAVAALGLMVAVPVSTGGEGRERIVVRSVAHPERSADAPARAMPGGPMGPGLGASWRLRDALPPAVAAWMAGVLVLSTRLAGGLVVAARRGRGGSGPPSAVWVDRLEALKERLGVRRAVTLLESSCLEVPTVIGWLRPAILVPASAWLGLSAAELEAILAHELAHVRRHDYPINLLQCLAETLLFYHPCARWASRAIRQEREHCCDDLAVAATGDRLTYARALAAMEGLRGPELSLSPAANGGTLLARVGRILEPQIQEEKPMRSLMMLTVLLAAAILAPVGLARVAAQQLSPTPPLGSPEPPKVEPDRGLFPGIPDNKGDADRPKPSPGRSYADIVTKVDEAPTGRLMFRPGSNAVRLNGNVVVVERPGTPGQGPSKIEVEADNIVIHTTALKAPEANGHGNDRIALDPPSDVEVCDRFFGDGQGAAMARRGDVKVTVELIGTKVDTVKVYPLAGPCQLVHVHYKATIEFYDNAPPDGSKPVPAIRRRTEVVFIEKDHLRRPTDEELARALAPGAAPAPEGADAELDRKLDEISRKVEALRRDRQKDREIRRQDLDRLRRDLDDLERRAPADPKGAARVAPIPPRLMESGYFRSFTGAFW